MSGDSTTLKALNPGIHCHYHSPEVHFIFFCCRCKNSWPSKYRLTKSFARSNLYQKFQSRRPARFFVDSWGIVKPKSETNRNFKIDVCVCLMFSYEVNIFHFRVNFISVCFSQFLTWRRFKILNALCLPYKQAASVDIVSSSRSLEIEYDSSNYK